MQVQLSVQLIPPPVPPPVEPPPVEPPPVELFVPPPVAEIVHEFVAESQV